MAGLWDEIVKALCWAGGEDTPDPNIGFVVAATLFAAATLLSQFCPS